MHETSNVSAILNNALCTGCGACAGICPRNAITMELNPARYFRAYIHEDCTNCGLCLKVCPSNARLRTRPDIGQFSGTYIAGYIGHATNPEIRQRAQSGGLVTALLTYMLENQLIDGAIVNKFHADQRRTLPHLAKSRAELLASAGSYYTQSAMVQAALDADLQKLAVIVTGCQSEALHHIRQSMPAVHVPEYTIGLICGLQLSHALLDDFLQAANVDPNAPIINYRSRDKAPSGWPGQLTVQTKHSTIVLPREKWYACKAYYKAPRCLLCADKLNQHADIACGDPWGVAGKQGPQGETVVLVRTEKGRQLLERAHEDGAIFIEPLDPATIIAGQNVGGTYDQEQQQAEAVYRDHAWMLPYSMPADSPASIQVAPSKADAVSFLRDAYQAKTQQEHLKMVARRKRQMHRDKRLRQIKRRIKKLLSR